MPAADETDDADPRAAGPSPRALRQRLESLADAGVLQLPRPRPDASLARPAQAAAATVASATPAASNPPADPPRPAPVAPAPPASPAPAMPPSDRAAALAVVRDEVAACRACAHLAAARTNTVFGVGDPAARLCFIGEAPGADEDASGIPFVGRAGQLLTKIIEACTMSRESVYILNVLKCRPPDNRRPEPGEVANCRGFFERQLEVIRPEFICCLGASAAQALLSTDEPIGKLRGRWFGHGSAAVICTYHPSYLLRNPAAKRDVWEDMRRLMERMGIEPPGAG